MKKLLLIDAYAMIYRAYYGFLRSPRFNSKGQNTSAIFGFVNTLEDALRRENPTHIAVVFDPSGKTFRHEIYKEYKAHREETPEDIRLSIPIIKDILAAYNIPVLQQAGYEADDVIGTLSVKASAEDFEVYMLTSDKDYGQLVGEHVFMYRPKSGASEYEVMGVAEVCAKFDIDNPAQIIDFLALMGDASDNIPGCPGVGEKTAVKLLKEFGNIDNLLKNTKKLQNSLRKKIEENQELIELSRRLTAIEIDVPIEFDAESLLRQKPDMDKLKTLFTELEFRSIMVRIGIIAPAATTSVKPLQQSLFDEYPTNSAKEKVQKGVVNTPPPTADLFVELDDISTTPHVYNAIITPEERHQLVVQLLQQKSVSFDTETTTLDTIDAELVGMSFCWKAGEAYYVPVPANGEEAQALMNEFKPFFENAEIEKTGQNMKFDLSVLCNYGVYVQGKLFDTMLAHYLLQPELRHNMDYLAEVYLKYKTIKINELIGYKSKNQLSMREVPIEKITDYAAEDADITFRLTEVLRRAISDNNLEKLFYEIEMPLMPVLAEMERAGVLIDSEALKQSSEILTETMMDLEKDIHRMADVNFNVSSAKQVGDVLFDRLKISTKAKRTRTGQYSTSEEELEKLRSKHPIVGKILNYRGLKKLLGTYIDALPALINERTGKVHTSFNQATTATGRLSSSNPNLQNIPIREAQGREIRKAFIAEPDCVFMAADYSQIELRIMAHLSEDENMIEAFNSGYDIHTATAAKIYKIPIEEVTSEMRRKAKTANFGIIYGISTFGLAERLLIPRLEAKELIESYFATYPKVKEYMEKSEDIVRENGFAQTLLGRKRYLPDINSRNAVVRAYAARNAINAPIQGTAADIIKIAMVNIHRRMKEANVHSTMILQVHDELDFNVPINEIEVMKNLVKEEMERAIQLLVPVKADIGVGANWLEAH